MPADIVDQMLPGEQVVWEGAPGQGIRVRPLDIPMVIFGTIFAIVGGVFAIALFPVGLLIPHLWVGLYFAFGHLWVDARIRASTAYAVTQSRAIIVHRWPWYRSMTINLTTTPQVTIQHHRDGTGSITFGAAWNPFAYQASFLHHMPTFQRIADVEHVAKLVHASSLGK